MITVISSPNQISSAYNHILETVSSNNTAQPNFNFVADVYVSGITGYTRLVYPKQPGTNQLTLDLSPVLKNYVQYNFIGSYNSLITGNYLSTVNYYVQFGEIYDVSGIATLFPDLVRNPTSNYKSAINTVFDFTQFSVNVLDNYDVSNGKFLNTVCTNYWKVGQERLLTFLDKDRIIDNYSIAFFTSAGVPAGVTQTGSLSLPADVNMFNLDLNEMFTGAVPSTTAYMIVSLYEGGSFKAFYRIDIDSSCSQFDTYRLHWLNQLGGWDTFNFTKATRHNEEIQRQSFKRFQSLQYTHSDRLKTTYQTTIMDSLNLQSDWITDAESDYLAGLMESPVVFLETSDGFVAYNVQNASYLRQKYLNGRKLFNFSVDIEPSYNRYRQDQ